MDNLSPPRPRQSQTEGRNQRSYPSSSASHSTGKTPDALGLNDGISISRMWTQLAMCQLSKWFVHFGPPTNWQNLFMFPSEET